jgi:uracil DNA glycosylase
MGCGHFSKTNQWLSENNQPTIDWSLPPSASIALDV